MRRLTASSTPQFTIIRVVTIITPPCLARAVPFLLYLWRIRIKKRRHNYKPPQFTIISPLFRAQKSQKTKFFICFSASFSPLFQPLFSPLFKLCFLLFSASFSVLVCALFVCSSDTSLSFYIGGQISDTVTRISFRMAGSLASSTDDWSKKSKSSKPRRKFKILGF